MASNNYTSSSNIKDLRLILFSPLYNYSKNVMKASCSWTFVKNLAAFALTLTMFDQKRLGFETFLETLYRDFERFWNKLFLQ